jgi:hypothetical protein
MTNLGKPPTKRRRMSVKKEREATKNPNGDYECQHQDCAHLQPRPFWARKCEWSKHMDKHERPYTCNEPECAQLQGFTYSGGLLRHEREVHRKHGGPKEALLCPVPNCKRNLGAGFTRRENLNEHLRRVHQRGSGASELSGVSGERVSEEPLESPREKKKGSGGKRKRGREEEELEESSSGSSSLAEKDAKDLKREVKRLRKQNEEKESRLERLEAMYTSLQRQIDGGEKGYR